MGILGAKKKTWREERSATLQPKLDIEYLVFSLGQITGNKNIDNILHADRVTCN